MRPIRFLLLPLLLAACAANPNTDALAPDERGDEAPDDQVAETPLLDPECATGHFDYVVRAIWPITPDDNEVVVNVRRDELRNINILEYEVHACRAFTLTGGAFWFNSMIGFPGEEDQGDPRDPTGIIIGENEYGDWVKRFYDFSFLMDGEVVGIMREMGEYTVADSSGSAYWLELTIPMQAGDVHTFAFHASVHTSNMPRHPARFSVEYAAIAGGAPSPNPFGRHNPWPAEITYPQRITLNP